MPTIEDNRAGEARDNGHAARYEHEQRRRMMIALGVLLLALILVLVKDRQFWFPSSTGDTEVTDSPLPMTAIPAQPPQPAPAALPEKTAPPTSAGPAHSARSHNAVMRSAPAKSVSEPPAAMIVTNRAVLPPLEVEVVAGNQHHPIQSTNNPLHLDLQPGAAVVSGEIQPQSPARDSLHSEPNATASVQLSPDTAQIVSRPVNPNYPLLAKQMKVQGAVVLRALISKTGSIQDIHVLSGPAILSAAAREAVQQWRFKPYLQAGQPVETEARITVNFTISTY